MKWTENVSDTIAISRALCRKKRETYSTTISWIQAKVWFELLRGGGGALLNNEISLKEEARYILLRLFENNISKYNEI